MRSLLFLAACASAPPIMVGDHPMAAEFWTPAERDIRQRASFELACPPEQLQIIPVITSEWGLDHQQIATQIGVAGCGHRLVYVQTQSGWVLNSSDAAPK
jgi:hypothetical protein